MSDPWVDQRGTDLIIRVKAIPKSGIERCVGWEEGALKIKIRAAPEDGKANEALLAYIAKQLEISPSRLSLVSGEKSRKKTIAISHYSRESFLQKIELLIR